ncbi:MAG: hypothetical protein JWQ94_556 [Tardiphaga sp.]|nr:hypothetical protein [Tardiphaga sp.]
MPLEYGQTEETRNPMAKKKKDQKPADDLQYMLAISLGIDPEGFMAKGICIIPMNDSWRAMSARHDDDPDFRSKVIKESILLAERYDLQP